MDAEAKWDALLIGAVGIGTIFIVLGILLISGVFDTVALLETLPESAQQTAPLGAGLITLR